MEDAPVEDERRRRGLDFLQQEDEIMKERPDFMRRFDRDITSQYRGHLQEAAREYYRPGDEGHPRYTEWALTRDEYKHLPEDEKRQYREWRRRLDACKRNNMRYSPYPKGDSGYQGRGYGRKEFSSAVGSRG